MVVIGDLVLTDEEYEALLRWCEVMGEWYKEKEEVEDERQNSSI